MILIEFILVNQTKFLSAWLKEKFIEKDKIILVYV